MPYIHRGIVEDNEDPEKAGRVRIRVFGMHSDNKNYVKTEDLPWALPSTPVGSGGARNIGSYRLPQVGGHVFVFFENGSILSPVYFAGAPAVEDVEDYQQMGGYLEENSNGKNDFKYDKDTQSDDDLDDNSKNREKKEEHRTRGSENEPNKLVPDWGLSTRNNIHTTATRDDQKIPESNLTDKDDTTAQGIFPRPKEASPDNNVNFFQRNIRVAFDGKASHDASGNEAGTGGGVGGEVGYDGIHHMNVTGFSLSENYLNAGLETWDEFKWGHNDDQHKDDPTDGEGGSTWEPTYPMVSFDRNVSGEITEFDTLKERVTYIHPSKYYHELVQLDSERQHSYFKNELYVKRMYERQRGVGNAPNVDDSGTYGVNYNAGNRYGSRDNRYREENKIEYDIGFPDGVESEMESNVRRFEERKHNPGRERTIVEDFVFRFYVNKVNETFNSDVNKRVYFGNDNIEVERGDINRRVNLGSMNDHVVAGNKHLLISQGSSHTHIDNGHYYVEVGGTAHDGQFVPDEVPNDKEAWLFDQGYFDALHASTTGSLGSDAKYETWPFSQENNAYNHYTKVNQGSLITHIGTQGSAIGHHYLRLNNGDDKTYLANGHSTCLLELGDHRVECKDGDIEQLASNKNTKYSERVQEEFGQSWIVEHGTTGKSIGITSSGITIKGPVKIDGNLEVTGDIKADVVKADEGSFSKLIGDLIDITETLETIKSALGILGESIDLEDGDPSPDANDFISKPVKIRDLRKNTIEDVNTTLQG